MVRGESSWFRCEWRLEGRCRPALQVGREQTPLWAAIYMVPLTVGFLIAGPVSGYLSDRFGARLFATAQHVPAAVAQQVADLPPVGSLFAAFLGYNPIGHLLGASVQQVPAANAATLTGQQFFPHLVSGPFHAGLVIVFGMSIVLRLISAVASTMRGGHYVHTESTTTRTPVSEPSGSSVPVGEPGRSEQS